MPSARAPVNGSSHCVAHQALILHVRGSRDDRNSVSAFADCLEVVKNIPSQQRIHLYCFTGDWPHVAAWSRSFPRYHFGFTGKAPGFNKDHRDALRHVPGDKLDEKYKYKKV